MFRTVTIHNRTRLSALIFVLGFLLVACGATPIQPTPVVSIGSTPGKSLATIWLSPTPLPSPFASPQATATVAATQPLPTLSSAQATLPISTIGALGSTAQADAASTPAPSALNCAANPAQPFGQVWQDTSTIQQNLGCPVGQPQQRNAAFQNFEHGFMVWTEADQSIYIISTTAILAGQPTDTWWRLPDTFAASDPVRDDSLVPPGGLLQPERGFGKVWRDNGFVRQALGWALQPEVGYSTSWLIFERGWMMTAADDFQLLFALAPSGGSNSNTGNHFGTHPITNP